MLLSDYQCYFPMAWDLCCSNNLIQGGVCSDRGQRCICGIWETFQVDQGLKKHSTLDVMVTEICKHKSYPSTRQIGMAAEALVSKRKKGSKTGHEGRQSSHHFSIGNYRTKLSSHKGCGWIQERVAGPIQRLQHPGPTYKGPRRGEVNFAYPIIPMEKLRTHWRPRGSTRWSAVDGDSRRYP